MHVPHELVGRLVVHDFRIPEGLVCKRLALRLLRVAELGELLLDAAVERCLFVWLAKLRGNDGAGTMVQVLLIHAP